MDFIKGTLLLFAIYLIAQSRGVLCFFYQEYVISQKRGSGRFAIFNFSILHPHPGKSCCVGDWEKIEIPLEAPFAYYSVTCIRMYIHGVCFTISSDCKHSEHFIPSWNTVCTAFFPGKVFLSDIKTMKMSCMKF